MSKASVYLIVCGLFWSFSSFVTAANHLQSKTEFIKEKVPKGHDFTKIAENARYRSGHLLVRFATKTDGRGIKLSEKKRILNTLGGATIRRNYKKTDGLTLIKLTPGQTLEDALKIYNAREDVLYAEPDYEILLDSTFPNEIDPPGRFNELWGMHNTGQSHPITGGGTSSGKPDADIDAPEAWEIITDANDIIVAVLDSGIDYTHPDLAANMWTTIDDPNDVNDDGYPGIGGVDDDGDGLIDEDSNGTSRFIDVENQIEDPNWTNDLFEDDDENSFICIIKSA